MIKVRFKNVGLGDDFYSLRDSSLNVKFKRIVQRPVDNLEVNAVRCSSFVTDKNLLLKNCEFFKGDEEVGFRPGQRTSSQTSKVSTPKNKVTKQSRFSIDNISEQKEEEGEMSDDYGFEVVEAEDLEIVSVKTNRMKPEDIKLVDIIQSLEVPQDRSKPGKQIKINCGSDMNSAKEKLKQLKPKLERWAKEKIIKERMRVGLTTCGNIGVRYMTTDEQDQLKEYQERFKKNKSKRSTKGTSTRK